MSPHHTRSLRVAVLGGVLAVGFTVLCVDRAASTWSYTHLHRPVVLDWLTHMVDPLRAAAAVVLLAMGLGVALSGWRPGGPGRTVLAACLAILVSYELKEMLKRFFGRTWPETWVSNNPSWIGDQVYGFHLLHGGTGWESFPSGHTTQMAALAAVVWLRLPKVRWVGPVLCLLVAIGLWGSDYHFVGDIVAGALLGAACGCGMVALVCPDPGPGGATPS